MREPEIFTLAERTLNEVVGQIGDDQWDMELPQWFKVSDSQKGARLKDIINYHAYDDAWVPAMLAGKTMAEVGDNAFRGDLLGNEPKTNFSKLVERAIASANKIEDLDATVHCSFGDYPIREYFWQINMFRGLRAHDIAKLIGVNDKLPEALVSGLIEELSPVAEQWRSIGVFGPRVEVPDDAPDQDKLLGLVGRQP